MENQMGISMEHVIETDIEICGVQGKGKSISEP